MARIELSIASDYVPRWGLWEGFREVVSNARDAEKEYSAPMSVEYADGKIKVKNVGCTLTSRALLLGASTKTGRGDMIGQWGEGLKLALLALTRAGFKVKVRSGGEVWVPRLERSEKFAGAQVLCVDIAKGRENTNRVSVEIDGVGLDAWQDLRRNVLWLDAKTVKAGNERVYDAGDQGQILGEPRHAGRIFVSGVWVQDVPEYTFGYNFTCHVDLDRDRRMIAEWNRQAVIAKMWALASSNNDVARNHALDMLAQGAREMNNLQYLIGYDASAKQLAEAAADRFRAQYGTEALPVADLEQAQQLEHLGAHGVVLTEAHREVLKSTIGDLQTAREKMREQVVRTYSWSDLTETQQANLTEALEMANLSGLAVGLAQVDVVDFRDAKLLGQYKHDSGRILLAAKVVADWRKCLMVLIHEAAHAAGMDGEKSHVATIEDAWSTLIEKLWR